MSLDDVLVTPKKKYRYLVGITLPESFDVTDNKVGLMAIPKSKYATCIVTGSIENVIYSWNYLYSKWLVNSGFEPNHIHAIEFFINKEHAMD